MSATGLESLEHTLQLTHLWINELDSRLGWDNDRRAYRLLKTVLHAIRDWLPINETVDLGAQLPELLRGAYYEGWRPAATPAKPRSRTDFRARIDHEFRRDPLVVTDECIAAVFALLTDKISAGEIENVRDAMPADIRAMWPAPLEMEKAR